MSDEQPWDKLPGEPSGAFASFSFYRDLGPDRSLRAVAQHDNKPISQIKGWSAKWSWVGRVDAYERWLDRQARAELERGRLEMSKRHVQISLAMQQKLVQRMQSLDPSELSVKDLAYWVDLACRLERVSRGLPPGETAVSNMSAEVEQSVKHLSADDRRELLAQTLRAIRTRIPEAGEPDGEL